VFLGAAVVGTGVAVGRTEELDDGLTAMVDADEAGVADTDGITIDVLLTIAFPETVELGVTGGTATDDVNCAVVRPMVATKTTKQEIQFISIFIFYNFTFENISLALIKMRYNVQRPPFFFLKNMTRRYLQRDTT